MSLSTSVSVLVGATGATLTGGAATTFINDGSGTNGAKKLVDSSNGNLLTRRSLTTRVVAGAAAPNSNALAKLGRSSVVVASPYVDANGKSYKLPDSFDFTYHPSMTQGERVTKFWNTIAMIVDAELLNLFTMGLND